MIIILIQTDDDILRHFALRNSPTINLLDCGSLYIRGKFGGAKIYSISNDQFYNI